MIDLHSHILPAIDDGPDSCEEAVKLIRMEIAGGVDTVALTPHYAFGRESIAEFAVRREESLERLKFALRKESLKINLVEGAEVFLSPELLKANNRKSLCYKGTAYMLVELPDYYQPDWISEVLYGLHLDGIIPVIAHVERYPYLIKDTQKLCEIIRGGALIQINADALLLGGFRIRSKLFKLMEHDLVHIIATDTHSVKYRPPNLRRAHNMIIDRYGGKKAAEFDGNCRAILENTLPDIAPPQPIKRLFWNR